MGFYIVMTDTSDDFDVTHTFDISEMNEEQKTRALIAAYKEIRKYRRMISHIKRFWRMQEDFYYPTQAQLESGDWTLEDLKPPSVERLLSWYEKSRKCWAEAANWLGF